MTHTSQDFDKEKNNKMGPKNILISNFHDLHTKIKEMKR